MRRSESWRHLNLKKLAAQWAYANGFRCIGIEVRAPRSRFRVDVAAYRPGRIRELQQRRAKLEELLLTHYPSLRAGESLLPEWDTFAGEFLAHDGYQRLLAGIIRIQNQLQDCTKFAWITRYRLANLHYMVAPEKLMTLDELPPGWGLLESNDAPGLRLRQPAQFMRTDGQAPWLERIGQSATARWLRQEGLVGKLRCFQPTLNL